MTRTSLALDADEAALREVARTYADRTCAVGDVRGLRDLGTEGFRPQRWADVIGMEWLGLAEPEDRGGSGAGVFHLGLVAGELGRRLVPTPLVPAAMVLAVLGSCRGPLADKVYDELLAGAAIVTFADAGDVTAAHVDGGYRLTGLTPFVPHVGQAHYVLVPATLAGQFGLFLVGLAGVPVRFCRLVDGQSCGHVELSGIDVADEALLAVGPDAECALTRARLRGSALAAAEIAGSLEAVAELAFTHLREREQFGVPIGTFQALQHRAARMHVAAELTVSTVRAALRAIDADAPDAAEAVHAAKAFAGDAFLDVAKDALQMHGGLGMTDEADVGLYLKRALVARTQYGSSEHHRARIAELRLGDPGSLPG